MIPELRPHEGSWIAIRRASGEVIGEFFDRRNVARFNPATVEIRTIGDHLARINASAKS